MSAEKQAPPEKKARNALPRDLPKRTVSALVLAAIVLASTWWGGIVFRLLMAAMGALVFYEWVRMRSSAHRLAGWYVPATGLAVVLGALVYGTPTLTLLAIVIGVMVVSALVEVPRTRRLSLTTGIAYAALPAIALVKLRAADDAGLMAVLFLFAVVWTTDIMAYFTGRMFGGPKLAPAISPGKTWSGALGGTLFAVVAGMAFAYYENALHGDMTFAMIAFLLAVVSQIGDLFESALKRRYGVKDSSRIIPGHGGIMDRVDGLLPAAIVLFVLAHLLVRVEQPAHALFGF